PYHRFNHRNGSRRGFAVVFQYNVKNVGLIVISYDVFLWWYIEASLFRPSRDNFEAGINFLKTLFLCLPSHVGQNLDRCHVHKISNILYEDENSSSAFIYQYGFLSCSMQTN
ncbi:unnamed protein product, partial [Callosobruchus maculatus]